MSLPYYFNIKGFSSSLASSLFRPWKMDSGMSIRRIVFLILYLPVFVFSQLVNLLGFLLDEIFFRDYRNLEIKKPLFVVGVPRSGTTFMHRLFSKDPQFTAAQTWELLFAPSITQKYFWRGVGNLDALIGSPLRRLVLWIEGKLLAEFNVIHKISLFEAEEDEVFMTHCFSSAFMYFLFPMKENVYRYIRFDEDIPAEERKKIMGFYRTCIQKHMYVYGRGKTYMTKNPAFSGKIRSIYETFPDARIACLIRTPYETVPSVMKLFVNMYKTPNGPMPESVVKELSYEATTYWYHYPASTFKDFPEAQHALVMYYDLIKDPIQVAERVYNRFGYEISEAYHQVLLQETEKSRNFKSKNSYSFEKQGISKEYIETTYSDVFERFDIAKTA